MPAIRTKEISPTKIETKSQQLVSFKKIINSKSQPSLFSEPLNTPKLDEADRAELDDILNNIQYTGFNVITGYAKKVLGKE
jgi:hypothetical protein